MTPTPLSLEARAELVRLAQEATHGVWHVWSSLYEGMKAAIVVVTPDDKSNTLFEARNYPDAVYVAAANPEAILSYEATVQALEVKLARPIPMILHCPACGLQHIDAPETDPKDQGGGDLGHVMMLAGRASKLWTNPPHRSHLCGGCGHIWRPADVPTEGVACIETKGCA